jgi:protein TonB
MHDFASLDECLVDADPAAATRARRRRRWAVLCSIAGQILLLSLILLAPLLATAELRAPAEPPDMIYIGRGDPPAAAQQQSAAGKNRHKGSGGFKVKIPFVPPTKIPHGMATSDESFPEIDFGPAPTGSIAIPGAIGGLGDQSGLSTSTRLPPAPVEKPQSKSEQLKVSEPVALARLVHRVEPRYPVLAKQMGLSGRVELRAIIARDGTVRDLQVLSGHPMFVRDTLEAILKWRFQPTLLNGEPVEVETRITVIFTLNR